MHTAASGSVRGEGRQGKPLRSLLVSHSSWAPRCFLTHLVWVSTACTPDQSHFWAQQSLFKPLRRRTQRQRVPLELPAPGFFGQGSAALSHPSPLGSSPNTGQARLEWSASTDSCVCHAALCDTATPWHNVKPTNKKAWSAPLFAMRSANVLRSYALCFWGILRENSRKH